MRILLLATLLILSTQAWGQTSNEPKPIRYLADNGDWVDGYAMENNGGFVILDADRNPVGPFHGYDEANLPGDDPIGNCLECFGIGVPLTKYVGTERSTVKTVIGAAFLGLSAWLGWAIVDNEEPLSGDGLYGLLVPTMIGTSLVNEGRNFTVQVLSNGAEIRDR